MTDPEDKLLAAIREEENDFTEALQEANDILYPDPAKALAAAISERKTAVREWKDCLKRCDALTADLVAIRGIVGRHGAPIAEAVRQIRDELIRERDLARADRDAARESTSEASAIAKTQRTAADNLRAALDRVATEAGVDTEGDGFDVADRVIAVIRGLKSRPVLTVERLADALRGRSR